MRRKITHQESFNYDPSSSVKIVKEYVEKYQRLDEILQSNPAILAYAHSDFQRWLSQSKQGREGERSKRDERMRTATWSNGITGSSRRWNQALLLRGSRDFADRAEYEAFLRNRFNQLNAGRWGRLQEELKVLRRLPAYRLDDCQRFKVKVNSGSTIQVLFNTYMVSSRLIGERVEARVYAERVEIWYAQRCVETLPRLRGKGNQWIDYRQIIGWLVRKPGAFANYRYRAELFPSSQFRMAYDALKDQSPGHADRDYLKILDLAAREGESRVEEILRRQFKNDEPIDPKSIESLLHENAGKFPVPSAVDIAPVDLRLYDRLMDEEASAWAH